MSTDMAKCACPASDAFDCFSARGRKQFDDHEDVIDAGGPCDCSCHDDWDDFDDWDDDRPATCAACGGSGEVVTCIDDMCRAIGECIHGDDSTCAACDGEGSL